MNKIFIRNLTLAVWSTPANGNEWNEQLHLPSGAHPRIHLAAPNRAVSRNAGSLRWKAATWKLPVSFSCGKGVATQSLWTRAVAKRRSSSTISFKRERVKENTYCWRFPKDTLFSWVILLYTAFWNKKVWSSDIQTVPTFISALQGFLSVNVSPYKRQSLNPKTSHWQKLLKGLVRMLRRLQLMQQTGIPAQNSVRALCKTSTRHKADLLSWQYFKWRLIWHFQNQIQNFGCGFLWT